MKDYAFYSSMKAKIDRAHRRVKRLLLLQRVCNPEKLYSWEKANSIRHLLLIQARELHVLFGTPCVRSD